MTSEPDTAVNSQPDTTDGQFDPKTLEMILALSQTTLGRQATFVNTLDTKMVQIFQAASVVIGLAGLSSVSSSQWWLADILLIGALISYGLTARTAFSHLRPRSFYETMPDTFWRVCWNLPAADAHHSAIDTITESYKLNRPTLEEKAGYIRSAIKTTAIEVVLVGAALILARIGSYPFWGWLGYWLSFLV